MLLTTVRDEFIFHCQCRKLSEKTIKNYSKQIGYLITFLETEKNITHIEDVEKKFIKEFLRMYGERYICDHPVYDCCTLFRIREKGLAVIQQRFDVSSKSTKWGEVDPWVANDLYLNPGFRKYFDERSGPCTDGLYPTVTVRQIMWALKMKPIPKQRWETVFDRRDI